MDGAINSEFLVFFCLINGNLLAFCALSLFHYPGSYIDVKSIEYINVSIQKGLHKSSPGFIKHADVPEFLFCHAVAFLDTQKVNVLSNNKRKVTD